MSKKVYIIHETRGLGERIAEFRFDSDTDALVFIRASQKAGNVREIAVKGHFRPLFTVYAREEKNDI